MKALHKINATILFILVLSALMGALMIAGKILRANRSSQAFPDPASRVLSQAAPAPWSRTERDVASLQQLLRENPKSSANHTRLGQAYLQKARETSDPSYLTKAEALFQKALGLDGRNFEAMAGMGSLCLSRHEFSEALRWGERGLAINPWSSELYGIVGDACVELGEYERAVRLIQKMVGLKPQLSSYSRVSYLRELHGDIEGAIQAMSMAVSSGSPSRENTAWCRVELGNLYFNKGDYRSAEREYQAALAQLPGYIHATAGLAKIKAAQGDFGSAVQLYDKVVAALPFPEYVIALGELYEVLGKPDLAKRQYELVEAMHQLNKANGVDVEMELALFQADHDRNLEEALEQAKRQFERQPNIKAADVLAWTLYKNGQYREALSTIEKALRVGTRAPLMLYHAGMIHFKAGDVVKAEGYLKQALSLNPRFSIRHAPEALKTLEELSAKGNRGPKLEKG